MTNISSVRRTGAPAISSKHGDLSIASKPLTFGSNVYAMIELGKMIAKRLGLKLIQYVDLSNSLHIYESDFKDVEAVFKTLEKRGIKIS